MTIINLLTKLAIICIKRDAMVGADSSMADGGHHLVAKMYEPAKSTKWINASTTPALDAPPHSQDNKNRSGSVTPEDIRRRRVSYAGRSEIYNYGYIGETRERMFDILINSQRAMSMKVISQAYNCHALE